jgi:hypothetical protein
MQKNPMMRARIHPSERSRRGRYSGSTGGGGVILMFRPKNGFYTPECHAPQTGTGGCACFYCFATSVHSKLRLTLVPMHNLVGKPIHIKGTHGHREQDRNRAESQAKWSRGSHHRRDSVCRVVCINANRGIQRLPEHATSTTTLEDDAVAVAGFENLAKIHRENLVCLGEMGQAHTLARVEITLNGSPIKSDGSGSNSVLASTSHVNFSF